MYLYVFFNCSSPIDLPFYLPFFISLFTSIFLMAHTLWYFSYSTVHTDPRMSGTRYQDVTDDRQTTDRQCRSDCKGCMYLDCRHLSSIPFIPRTFIHSHAFNPVIPEPFINSSTSLIIYAMGMEWIAWTATKPGDKHTTEYFVHMGDHMA